MIDDRFKYIAVFSEQLGSVEATKQALHIFRNVSEIHYLETSKTSPELPLARDDIINTIISKEKYLSDIELIFRAPKIGEINYDYGFAYNSYII